MVVEELVFENREIRERDVFCAPVVVVVVIFENSFVFVVTFDGLTFDGLTDGRIEKDASKKWRLGFTAKIFSKKNDTRAMKKV